MELHKIESSLIAATGHEGGVLTVEFNDGTVYEYQGVTPDLHNELRAAESPGRFFHQRIKGQFESRKVPLPEEEVQKASDTIAEMAEERRPTPGGEG